MALNGPKGKHAEAVSSDSMEAKLPGDAGEGSSSADMAVLSASPKVLTDEGRLPGWSRSDSEAAMAQGWEIFPTDRDPAAGDEIGLDGQPYGHRPFELQALDDSDVFVGDLRDALAGEHVRDLCAKGDPLAIKARDFLAENSPREYAAIFKPNVSSELPRTAAELTTFLVEHHGFEKEQDSPGSGGLYKYSENFGDSPEARYVIVSVASGGWWPEADEDGASAGLYDWGGDLKDDSFGLTEDGLTQLPIGECIGNTLAALKKWGFLSAEVEGPL